MSFRVVWTEGHEGNPAVLAHRSTAFRPAGGSGRLQRSSLRCRLRSLQVRLAAWLTGTDYLWLFV